MGSEWREAFLTELYEIRSGLSKPAKDFGTGYPFLAFKDVFYNFFVPESLSQLVQSSEKERESCSVRRGDIFLTRTSETMHELGMSCVALKDYEHATFNGFTKRLRPKAGIDVIPEYAGYFLRSSKFRNEMMAFSTMSTRASLNNEMISCLKLVIPPLPEQKVISHVLGSLDDRIELNRRMNETLESMAQALFKSWFVDFDPVIDNALASGKEIPSELSEKAQARAALGDKRQPLPEEIRTLFPDEFTYSDELGWIPKGWEVKSIDEILMTVSETYPLKSVEKVVFLNTGDILDGQFLHHNYSNTTSLPGQAKKSIMKDDILYSEIRPKNRRFAYVYFDSPEHVVSTKLMVLRAISNIKSIFAYFILKQQTCIDYLQMMAESRSGTFPQITFDVLSTINVALPDKHAITDYFTDNILERSFQKSVKNNSNSKSLSALRDTLLPKLLSGELRIPDAEKMVEELAL